jgi:DNA-binding NarL/FixJ family response regulator
MLASELAGILEGQPDLTLCGVTRTGAEAIADALRYKADMVIVDFKLPDMSGAAAAGIIRDHIPEAAIVFCGADESEAALFDAIDAGAIAYLTKSTTGDQFLEAIRRASLGEVLIPVSLFAKALARQRTVLANEHEHERRSNIFTARELEVLKLLAEGLDTIGMSQRLGIAGHTVEWHVRHVIEKLEVHSKLQAVIAGARLGLIELEKP